MSALTDQVDDHETRLEALEDSSSSDESDAADIADRVQTLEDNAGQLQFPLSQDSIDLIKEIFPIGTVTLIGGTATIKDPRISAGSNIQLTRSAAAGTLGNLSYSASAGQAVVNSDNVLDVSDISYVIFS